MRGAGGGGFWRELDDAGREATVLEQLEAHYATAWLWWLSMLWERFNRLDANQQALLGSLAFVASAQQHQLPAVPWPARWLALCRRLRWPPSTSLMLAVLLAGALVAALAPVMSGHVLLRDVQSGQLFRLTQSAALAASGRPSAAWRQVARGGWARAPAELALSRAHQLSHAAFVACVAAAGARLAYQLQ